jgi:hypothetical protein
MNPKAWSRPWPRTRRPSKAGSASWPARSRRSATFGPVSRSGKSPTAGELARLLGTGRRARRSPSTFPGHGAANGSNSRDVRPLNYIIGPLGSGKTRLAKRLAEALPGAVVPGPRSTGARRRGGAGATGRRRRHSSPGSIRPWPGSLKTVLRFQTPSLPCSSDWSPKVAAIVVVDMVEQGLDRAAQEALIASPAPPRARRAAAVSCSRAPARSWTSPPWAPHEAIILLSRQSQPPDQRRPISRCPRLRGGRHVSGVARSACADGRRHCVETPSGVRPFLAPSGL